MIVSASQSWFLVSRHLPALHFHVHISIHYWDFQQKKSANFRQKKKKRKEFKQYISRQTQQQGLLFDGELLIAHLKSSPWTQLESDL